MDKLDNYDIIKTEDEGNCAIHSVLYGLQRVYKNKQIVDILNKYLESDEQISEVVLKEETPKIRYSTDTTNAFRKALYNYYHTYENELHIDLKLLDTDPSKFTSENIEIFKSQGVNVSKLVKNSTNELPHYKNIIKDTVWLTDIDLYYICKLFDICIKLRNYELGEYYWRLFNPNMDIDDMDSNTEKKFKEQCEKVIYIQYVNGNHYQALIPKGSKFKRPRTNKTMKSKLKEPVSNLNNKTSKKKQYYNKTSKFQYPSNHTTQPKSNNIILGGLALVGIGVGVLVAIS